MRAHRPGTPPRGFTLTELLVAVAITAVLVALASGMSVALSRDQNLRENITDMQGSSRLALGWMEHDLRRAALGVGTGIVWTEVGGNRASRPAVQVFANLAGGGFLAVKPGTSAVLIVNWLDSPRAAVVGALTTSAQPIPVTTASGFAAGTTILMGDYGDATWGVVSAVDPSNAPPTLTLASAVNLLPGLQLRDLGAGSPVRRARARLYFVDTADELVQATLSVPRAPLTAAEVTDMTVLSTGFENLQVDCRMDDGLGGFAACPGTLDAANPIASESAAAFGTIAAGRGPRLAAEAVGGLRALLVDVAVRTRRAVDAPQGDAKVALQGVTLPAGGDDTKAYARRAYHLAFAVRNTSLGAY